MPVTVNMTWFQGEAYSITDTITSGGTAVDITGWAVAFLVSRTYSSTPVITKTTGGGSIALTTPISGLLTITVLESDTLGLSQGSYKFAVWRTDVGDETLLTEGVITVHGAIPAP